MKNNSSKINMIVQSGTLLIPGFLVSLLTLLLSSNRIFPQQYSTTLFLLNTTQLFSFGVTIAKYASDQMILSKLQPNETVANKIFLLKRVLPLSSVYCIFLFLSHDWRLVVTLFLCIPIEVYVINVIIEFNIAKKYYHSLCINLTGYALIYSSYLLLSLVLKVNSNLILFIFLFFSVLKGFIASRYRIVSERRVDVLVTSPHVPFQQAGNYFLFKADQLMIAMNVIPSFLFAFVLPTDYLFYPKFIDVFAGIATSLSPIIASFSRNSKSEISLSIILKSKTYHLICFVAIFFQVAASLFFLKKADTSHLLLLLPFCLTTLLIVPVNLINYEHYRTNHIKEANLFILISILTTSFLVLINLFLKSLIVFAFMVPTSLMIFIGVALFNKKRKNVQI